MPPLVSVVVPYYEGEEYVETTLRSVDEQTYSPLEILVVDDGSERPAADVLDGFRSDLDVGITVIRHDENRGISAARNTGVEAATGEYITILDQDDAMCPEKVATQIERMANNESLGTTLTNVLHIEADGTPIGPRNLRQGIGDESTDEIVRHLFQCWTHEAGPLSLTTELTRAAVYDDVGGYDEDLYAANDREFLFRVASDYDVAVIDQPLLRKRYHDANASRQSRKLLADRRRLTDRVIEYHPSLEPYRDRRMAFLWLLTLRSHLADGNVKRGVSCYFRALRAAPAFTCWRTVGFPLKVLRGKA